MIVVAQKCGRLGNRLLLAGHLLALAIEHSVTIYDLAMVDYAESFLGTYKDSRCRLPSPAAISYPRWASSLMYGAANITARSMRKARLGGSSLCVVSTLGDGPSHDVDLTEPDRLRLLKECRVMLLLG